MSQVSTYLYFNFLPDNVDLGWLFQPLRSFQDSFEHTPMGAASVLDETIDDLLNHTSVCGDCVVPISGGWDSRILLGAALERFDHKQIKTVTFGVPGALDYEIGAQIAKRFSLDHHAVDLSQVELTWKGLLESVRDCPWTYVPDGFFNRLAVSQATASDRDIVLSGFLGDPLTGGHLSATTTQSEAIDEFVARQRREKSLWLPSPDYDPRSVLPELPEDCPIPIGEFLDLGVRQANCIAPIVTPQKRWRRFIGDMGQMSSTGARVLAPFSHPKWAAYWLGLPEKFKRGQNLYLEMMKYKFPRLADIPSKYSWGWKPDQHIHQWMTRTNFGIRFRLNRGFPRLPIRSGIMDNYLDCSLAFRSRQDYQIVLDIALKTLTEGQIAPWLDLELIRMEHMDFRSDHQDALLVLIGLALNLVIDRQCGFSEVPFTA